MTAPVVGGLDGCRAGWILVTMPAGAAPGPEGLAVTLVEDLESIVVAIDAGRLAAAGVDIPIGLSESQPRACDRAARRALGPRRNSVFPAPARSVLGATSYGDACDISRRACGKAISKQLFNILPKILEVDRLQSPSLQNHLFEICPELSFTLLHGEPMRAPKRTPAGRAERLDALRPVFGDVTELVLHPPAGAAVDDVLDALAGAWTTRRYVERAHVQLGGERDETGLRMEVIA